MMMMARLLRQFPRSTRAFSTSFAPVPEHIRQTINLTTPTGKERCMIIGKPRYKYPIAVVPPPAEVDALFQAIREFDSRPFRIISYEDDSGRVFNCSFFDNAHKMQDWLEWLDRMALQPDSPHHEGFAKATGDGDEIPTPTTLLFGRGRHLLKDTRFGEYQVGMSMVFTRQVPVDGEQHQQVCETAASDEFEGRIARCMEENGVAYFGRLAMMEDAASDAATDAAIAGYGGEPPPQPALVTGLRYGSMEDARRGTELVRELMLPELTQWFNNEHMSLTGTTTKVLEL